MARRLFFVPEVRRGAAELAGDDAEHLTRVLRVEAGETYEISDNRRRYLARIQSARKSLVVFEVVEELAAPGQAGEVHLFPALFKFERLELLIEKATELGVTSIRPVEATRSERGLAQAAVKRSVRWARIATEASQQARRTRKPKILPVERLDALDTGPFTVKLLLDEDPAARPILEAIAAMAPAPAADDRIAVILGPEGGWTEQEKTLLERAGWIGCSLGSTVLRAETAAIAALSVINAVWRR